MIPTSYKAKLPKFLSYPIGAELLTEGLSSVPQLDKLTVSFSAIPGLLKKDLLFRSRPYRVVEVSYKHLRPTLSSPNPKSIFATGYYDETWGIWVSAVPSELKSKARQLLLEEGLPKVVSWLSVERTPLWMVERQYFEVLFDETNLLLQYTDSTD